MGTVARVGRILRAVALLAVPPTLAVALLAEPERALLLAELVLVLQVLPVALASLGALGRPPAPRAPLEEELLALEPVVLELEAPVVLELEAPPGPPRA